MNLSDLDLLRVHVLSAVLVGPRRDKNCHRGYRQSEFQISLLSYRD